MSNRHPGSRLFAALNRRRWELTRLRAFERDGWRCTGCGRMGRLEAHHVKALADGGDPYHADNVATLCRGCHIAAHIRPVTDEESQWRELVDEVSR